MREFLLLVFTHYLADFGLQSDWMAKNKGPAAGEWWVHVMVAHCGIQALGVLLVTNSASLAMCEFIAHFAIDYGKCRGYLTFTQDQLAHFFCRFIWWMVSGVNL